MPNLIGSLMYTPHELQFGTSGLRGLVADMTDLECYINTVGFLRFLVDVREMKAGDTVYVAGDLRQSTPRIMKAVAKAVRDNGFMVVYCGLVPTPTISLLGFTRGIAGIMVTGSHIPADRNGIKFIKPHDEVLKTDEAAVKARVASTRAEIYRHEATSSGFDESGGLTVADELPDEITDARDLYASRYIDVFGTDALANKKVVFYQHSAVGRDMLADLFEKLGAQVERVGRSSVFIPIDSENVTAKDEEYFDSLAKEYPDAFAIVSTDGDSDRPFVIDEHGIFHRGDVLGAVVAEWLQADFAAFPVSASDATDKSLSAAGIGWKHTKIGSPHVIACMKDALATGSSRVVGWEVNGGFLLGSDLDVRGKRLGALPTRDAFVAIVIAMLAASEKQLKVSELFAALPQRFSQAGLMNDFPQAVSQKMIQRFDHDTLSTRQALEPYFAKKDGFSAISSLNTLDGIRILFENGEVAHLRPSGNAPQLRVYSVADSQGRADEIVAAALAEPNGIFRTMQREISVGIHLHKAS